jgi:hypothetical protein
MQMADQLFEELRSVLYRYKLNKDTVKRSCSLLQNLVMFAARYMFRPVREFMGLHTGRFIMLSVITNIYNKKTKGKLRVSVCGNNLNIVSMCAVSPVVHTSNISSCKKKKSFPVVVNNSIKVGPLGLLL